MAKLWDNPIFAREFTAAVRCRKTLALTLFLVAVLALVLFLLWPRSGIFSETNSNEIFSIFLNVNLALIVLLIPGFVATTITQERENSSFDLLFTSMLTPVEIMVGKLFAALGITFLVVIISMPITALCALSGGISGPLLTRTYGVILLATLTYGLLGLALSSVCQRSFTALVWTYLGILALGGATWLPSVLLPNLVGLHTLWHAIRCLSPFEALLALNHPERYERAVAGLPAEQVFRLHLIGMSVLALLFLFTFCRYVLRPPAQRRKRTVQQYTDTRTMLRRKLMFPFYLIDPLRRRKPIAVWRNPVFVAEIRSRIFGHPKFILRSLAACMVLCMSLLTLVALQFATQHHPDTVRLVAIVFQVGVAAFFAPAVCSGSITDERTSGTLVLLEMTGLPTWTVVSGQIRAGLLYALIFLARSLPVLWAMAYLETQADCCRILTIVGLLAALSLAAIEMGIRASTAVRTWVPNRLLAVLLKALVWMLSVLPAIYTAVYIRQQPESWRVIAWAGVLIMTAITFVAAGLCASTLVKSTGVATAVSYCFSALVCLGSLSVLLFGTRIAPQLKTLVLSCNPLVAALQITSDTWFTDLPLLFGNRLWQNNLMFLCGMTVLLLGMAAARVHMIFNHREN